MTVTKNWPNEPTFVACQVRPPSAVTSSVDGDVRPEATETPTPASRVQNAKPSGPEVTGSAADALASTASATATSEATRTGQSVGVNRLAEETSPYLLQHASNPVDWHPWGEEALARARDVVVKEKRQALLNVICPP